MSCLRRALVVRARISAVTAVAPAVSSSGRCYSSVTSSSSSSSDSVDPPKTPRLANFESESSIAAAGVVRREVRHKKIPGGARQVRKPSWEKELLMRWKLAVSCQDAEDAWRIWTSLEERDSIGGADEENFVPFIQLMEKSVDSQGRLSQVARDVTNHQKWQSFLILLQRSIARQEYNLALEMVNALFLYTRREDVRHSKSMSPPRSLLSQALVHASVAFAKLPNPSVVPLTSLVRNLRPFKINIAGAKDTAVSSTASNGSPLSLMSAATILRSIFADPKDADLSLQYCRHAILAWGLDYKPESAREEANYLAIRFNLLFQSNQDDTVQMLLSTAQEAASKEFGSWLRVSSEHDLMADWNDMTWYVLLSASISGRDKALASDVWSMYNNSKEPDSLPNSRIWNGMLDGYAKTGEWDSVRQTWQQMEAAKCKPDIFVYTTMMSALFRAGLANEALLMLSQVKEKAAKGELKLTSEAISAVLHGLLLNERTQEATQMFMQMREGKSGLPKPTINSVNVFLRAYGRRGELDKIVEMLQSVSALALEPDVVTYTTVLDAFNRREIEGATAEVSKLMQQLGVRESGVTMSATIRNILRVEDDTGFADFVTALNLLNRMEQTGPRPNEVTYTCIIQALMFHSKHFSVLYRSGKIRAPFYNRMQRYEASNRDAASAVLKMRPHLQLAMVLLYQMERRGLRCNRVTSHTLLSGLLEEPMEGEGGASRHVNRFCLSQAVQVIDRVLHEPDASVSSDTWILTLQRFAAWLKAEDSVIAELAKKHLTRYVDLARASEHALQPALSTAIQKADKQLQVQ